MGELMNMPSPGAVGSGANYGDTGALDYGSVGETVPIGTTGSAPTSSGSGGPGNKTIASGMSGLGGGFKAFSDVMEGYAAKSQAEFKSKRLEESAQYGRVAAQQTGAQLTEHLNTTLGNIDAIRAAADTDPFSATGAAVRGRQEYVGQRDRDIKMANLQAQARRDEEEAKYLREYGKYAVTMGYVKGAASLASSIGKGMTGGIG